MNTDQFTPAMDSGPMLYLGQHESDRSSPVTLDGLKQGRDLGYDFMSTPLTTPFFHNRIASQIRTRLANLDSCAETPMPLVSPLSPVDTVLVPHPSNSSLVGVVSPWIDLSSSDPIIANVSRQVLGMEVAYAAFCGISNVVIHGPIAESGATQYARAVAEILGLGPYVQVHVLMATSDELESAYGGEEHLSEFARTQQESEVDDESDAPRLYGTWELWDTIRTLCNYSQKLSLGIQRSEIFTRSSSTNQSSALEIPRQLPPLSLQSRWFAEPIRILVFPRTTFLRNAKDYPVLSKQHQQWLSRFATLRQPPWILLGDVDRILKLPSSSPTPEPTPAEAATKKTDKPKDPVPHLRYIRHLQQTQPPLPPMLRFGQGYQDYLQSPLQPLTDNLESITYEVFEKDPVKYEWYERAIASAIEDLNGTIECSRKIIIAVVGSGRGPLVTRALQAGQKTGVAIRCWAVEKNPNAFVLLQGRNATDPLWNGQVNVVKSDMRHWAGPVIDGQVGKVDIMVSELLGSFADNELSPECLDGVQHVLHHDHGINIPQSYSAHLTPIASPRLHADLLSRSGSDKWELPYVVMLHQHDYLCRVPTSDDTATLDVREAWSFAHPAPQAILEQSRARASGSVDAGGFVGGNGSNEHNARECKLMFTVNEQGVCHGLAAYFETVLYAGSSGKTELSTNPVTMEEKSKDMISWFPIFFPLKTPLHVPDGAEMQVSMWRQTDDRGVWYEWLVEVFDRRKGRRRLGMSELHSSRCNKCLV